MPRLAITANRIWAARQHGRAFLSRFQAVSNGTGCKPYSSYILPFASCLLHFDIYPIGPNGL